MTYVVRGHLAQLGGRGGLLDRFNELTDGGIEIFRRFRLAHDGDFKLNEDVTVGAMSEGRVQATFAELQKAQECRCAKLEC
ncbi:hypothetical protein XB05_18990 [Xanthomonas arboricola]|nr:hypothetical protein XB05_18990 [Xanthomonas arboricola]